MSLPAVTGVAPRWESRVAELIDGCARVQLVRRCADVPELLGVAAAGSARLAVVSSDFRSLDRAAVEALLASGVAVVGVHPPDQPDAGRALSRWGVPVVVPVDVDAQALDEAVGVAADDLTGGRDDPEGDAGGPGRHRAGPDPQGQDGPGPRQTALDASRGSPVGTDCPGVGVGVATDTVDEELRALLAQAGGDPDAPSDEDGPALGPGGERGQVVVVWGPGSPGRTTVAVNLAAELADPLTRVVLVDADTYGACVAQCLAVLDEAPGLAAAVRAADQGTLDRSSLGRLAPEVRPGLQLLSGLPRAERWPEVRDSALADVIEVARRGSAFVVVDVAACVEQDEELSFDTLAPRRNGAALTALEAADRVVVVGAGDPVGLQRLVRGLDALPALTGAAREVVVTRVRPGPVGPEPQRRIREALERFAGATDVHLVPEDRETLDAALLRGRTLGEVRPAGPARSALRELADRIAGREPVARRAGPRRWPRRTPS